MVKDFLKFLRSQVNLTYGVKIGNNFVEKTQTLQALIINCVLGIKICGEKREK